nr:hypothetical protein [Lachnospiraceae bacterium]
IFRRSKKADPEEVLPEEETGAETTEDRAEVAAYMIAEAITGEGEKDAQAASAGEGQSTAETAAAAEDETDAQTALADEGQSAVETAVTGEDSVEDSAEAATDTIAEAAATEEETDDQAEYTDPAQLSKEREKQWRRDMKNALKSQRRILREERAEERLRIREENRIIRSNESTPEEKEAAWQSRMERALLKKQEKEAAREEGSMGLFMENLMAFTDIRDDAIGYDGEYYGGVLQIDPVAFRFFTENEKEAAVDSGLAAIFQMLPEGEYANLMKIDRPLSFESYQNAEKDKLDQLRIAFEEGRISEGELKSRTEVICDQLREMKKRCVDRKVVVPHYYLALFDEQLSDLNHLMEDALALLRRGNIPAKRLGTKELAVLLKYSNQIDFDETLIDSIDPEDYVQWAMPDYVKCKARQINVSHVLTKTYRVCDYPTRVRDAFLAKVMSVPGTKVMLKATPIDRISAVNAIDQSLQELRSRYASTVRDSAVLKLKDHIASLSELLGRLQNDNEVLMDVNIYVTIYDICETVESGSYDYPEHSLRPYVEEMEKTVKQFWDNAGLGLVRMDYDQLDGFVASQISGFDPLRKQARGIPSKTLAAAFPWIYPRLSKEGGTFIGYSDQAPVFADFYHEKPEDKNPDLLVTGGEDPALLQSIVAQLATTDGKVFVIDPKGDYRQLCENMCGKQIRMHNASLARINPFAFRECDLSDQLAFLERFYRMILPGCDKTARRYLGLLTERMYERYGIDRQTQIGAKGKAAFPIFDDLYEEVLYEQKWAKSREQKQMLSAILRDLGAYCKDGKYADYWNGPTTLEAGRGMNVFGFDVLLTQLPSYMAQAQLLLLLRHLTEYCDGLQRAAAKEGRKSPVTLVLEDLLAFSGQEDRTLWQYLSDRLSDKEKKERLWILSLRDLSGMTENEKIRKMIAELVLRSRFHLIEPPYVEDEEALCKLYEKTGIVSHREFDLIRSSAKKVYLICSDKNRAFVEPDYLPVVTDLVTKSRFVSHYFSGKNGKKKWDELMTESRQKSDILRAQQESAAALNEEVMSTRADIDQTVPPAEDAFRLNIEKALADRAEADYALALEEQAMEEQAAEGAAAESPAQENTAAETAISDEIAAATNAKEDCAAEDSSVESSTMDQAAIGSDTVEKMLEDLDRVENSGNSVTEETDLREELRREREEIARLQTELEREKLRMEKERLDSERQLLMMERAVFEARKKGAMQDAFASLTETIKQMQDAMRDPGSDA